MSDLHEDPPAKTNEDYGLLYEEVIEFFRSSHRPGWHESGLLVKARMAASKKDYDRACALLNEIIPVPETLEAKE